MPLLHLDYETFSELPLGDVGTHRYVHHESTEVLLAAFAVDGGPVFVLEGFNPRLVDRGGMQTVPGFEFPWTTTHDFLYKCLTDSSFEIAAYNAEFERLLTTTVVGIITGPERYLCTMARAWSLSFAGPMEQVARQIWGTDDETKLKHARGKRMMQKFCKPRNPSKNKPETRWTPEMDPTGWDEFKDYCGQDITMSRNILRYCNERMPWHLPEREMWTLDQRINDTGWPVDTVLVNNACRVLDAEESKLRTELEELTGLKNPNSVAQFKPWLEQHGSPLPNLQAATVTAELAVLETLEPDCPTARALKLRQMLARATPKKWRALRNCTFDGRIQATLEFGAASRTQRWAGRVFQPQNLFSEREHDTDELADILTYCDRDTVEALYGDVQRVLSGGIRPAITARPRHLLVVCDLSSIESRLLGWHSGESRINNLFATGGDTYKDLASRVFNIPVDEVTKAQRTFCKPPELGCGYLLGGEGLVQYAADMGVEMTLDEAKRIVQVWRHANPMVCAMWDTFKRQLELEMTARSGHTGPVHGVRFEAHGRSVDGKGHRAERLQLHLPSGRSIYYHDCRWGMLEPYQIARIQERLREQGRSPDIANRDNPQFLYWGRLQDQGGAWAEIHTHPGKITENIIQAVARDILRDALLAAAREGFTIVGHVHDEIVLESPEHEAEHDLETLTHIMSTTPKWAPGLLLDAEGFVTRRYKKG